MAAIGFGIIQPPINGGNGFGLFCYPSGNVTNSNRYLFSNGTISTGGNLSGNYPLGMGSAGNSSFVLLWGNNDPGCDMYTYSSNTSAAQSYYLPIPTANGPGVGCGNTSEAIFCCPYEFGDAPPIFHISLKKLCN